MHHNMYMDDVTKRQRLVDSWAGEAYKNCEYIGQFTRKKIYRCDLDCTGTPRIY